MTYVVINYITGEIIAEFEDLKDAELYIESSKDFNALEIVDKTYE